MPVYRTYRPRSRCAYASPEPVTREKKPRAPKKKLTEEEKTEAAEKREAKKDWDESLVEWKKDENFKWPTGTLGMYKSDAKSHYGLTETEMLTLTHESITGSKKSFFSYHDVKDLAHQKFALGAQKDGFELPEHRSRAQIRLFRKVDHLPNRRVRTNWFDRGLVDLRILEIQEGMDNSV